MFSRISRYRRTPDVVSVDARGRRIEAKDLRPLPGAAGELLHTLEDGERLDRLAHRYYRQPRKWWRICDANPDFLSPLSLLGREPLVTVLFPLSCDHEPPSWSALLAALWGRVGVEDVRVVEEERYVPAAGGGVETVVERAVLVIHNRMSTSTQELAEIIHPRPAGDDAGEVGRGFDGCAPQPIGRAGKPIVIPPEGGA